MKKALIICGHRVPTAEPNAIRLINIALMLQQLGYKPTLYGVYNDDEIRGEERGIPFVQWSQTSGHGIGPHQKRKEEFYKHVKNVVENTEDISLIISAMNNTVTKAHRYARKYAQEHGIIFVQSLVEWYGLAQLGGIKRLHRYIHCEYLMRVEYVRSRNIISISSYMADYYRKKGCRTIVIPTMVDMREYAGIEHTPNERITIVYAGSPRRKDCIANAILALEKLSETERMKIQFHVFGSSEIELMQVGLTPEVVCNLGDSFVVHGRIPYAEVKQYVANADYTILLRHDSVNANAGFSTKVGESMACGTPVICNLTSDLALYVKDGLTGIVCENETVEACVMVYRRILGIDKAQYAKMRMNAKAVAETDFNLNTYVGLLRDMIEEKI